ncbi:MAG: hypothetical protein WB622_14480 [Acidobacteriaceae bacterium]
MLEYRFYFSAEVTCNDNQRITSHCHFPLGETPLVPVVGDEIAFRRAGRRYWLTIERRTFQFGINADRVRVISVSFSGAAKEGMHDEHVA